MNYIRKDIQKITGYKPGEQPKDQQYIKLNTNENPYPPSNLVAEAISHEAGKLRLYSDPASTDLCQKAAEIYHLQPEQIIAGNGSDDILNIIIRSAAKANEEIAGFYPSYTLYQTLSQLHGARYKSFNFTKDYQIPEDLELDNIKVLFLPNPNSPSATIIDKATISRLCRRCPGLVVIDEAYADFADENSIPLLQDFTNLIITRSFSKSYALAGLRVGLGLARAEIITQLNKVKDSYNLGRIPQAAAIAALQDQNWLQKNCSQITDTRDRFIARLKDMGVFIYPSQANFVLARFTRPTAREIQEKLRAQGILVRYFDSPGLSDCLRITIGTEPEMNLLLDQLGSLQL